jgi:hypothetical protein
MVICIAALEADYNEIMANCIAALGADYNEIRMRLSGNDVD